MICPCLFQRRGGREGTLRSLSILAYVRDGKGQRESFVDHLSLLMSEEGRDREKGS